MITARQLGAYTVVGTAATGVHLRVLTAGVPLGLSPLVANALGFCIAFVIAFAGHARWSFPIKRSGVPPALWRFAVVSVLTFGVNEVVYAGALRWSELDYRVVLFAIVLAIAGLKLLVCKHWAF